MLRTRHRIGRPAGSEVKMLRLHPCELVNFFGVRAGSSCLNESKLPGQAGRQTVAGRRDISPRNWVNFGWRLPGSRRREGSELSGGQMGEGWRARSCFAVKIGKLWLAFAHGLAGQRSKSCPSRQAG